MAAYGSTMFRRNTIGTFVGLGLLAELIVFAAVADRIGFGSAMLVTFAISAFGVIMLRRTGTSALLSLRTMAEAPLTREGALVDGMLAALGAVLLIVPGFLTDLGGLLLLAPSGRQWLVRRLGVTSAPIGRPRPTQTGTIDLGAGDFTRLDNLRSP